MPAFCGRLIDSNAYPPCLRGARCILVYSGCLRQQRAGRLLDIPLFDDCAAFAACPEEHHINMLGFKLAGMVARARPEKLVVVTVDGSMHCIQLHYLAEELEKLGLVAEREHYVVEGDRLVRIGREAVRLSRFLSRLSRLVTDTTRA